MADKPYQAAIRFADILGWEMLDGRPSENMFLAYDDEEDTIYLCVVDYEVGGHPSLHEPSFYRNLIEENTVWICDEAGKIGRGLVNMVSSAAFLFNIVNKDHVLLKLVRHPENSEG